MRPVFKSKHVITAALLAVFASPASADLFSSLYTSTAPKVVPKVEQSVPSAQMITTGARCLSAILAAEERHDIPDHLLLAIGIQEAGRNGPEGLAVWPWTVNAAGEGRFFKSREDAQAWVYEKQAEGVTSIDIGCMQINMRWHGEEFPSEEAMFDPERNVDYAARFLRNLYRQTGSWEQAAGRYHSGTQKHQNRYLTSLKRNKDVVASQLPRLTALARSVIVPERVAEVTAPKTPPPPVFWAADASTGASYSIYSTKPLLPVLPAFQDSF